MWNLIVNLLLAGVLLATPVWGEYYQYTDENGVLRFTDNIASIPQNQRPDVKTHESVKSIPVPKKASARTVGTGTDALPSPASGTQPIGNNWAERSSRNSAELNRMQVTLNETFMALQNERAATAAKAPGPGASSKESGAYNKQVDALNTKIDRYEEQLKEYKKRQRAFNAEFRK